MPLGCLRSFEIVLRNTACFLWRSFLVLIFAIMASAAFAANSEVLQPTAESVKMSQRVDELIALQWRSQGIEPAEHADDSELLRRLYLDLTGVVPPVSEVRSYLAETSSDKTRELIGRLLVSPAHATHLAHTWRDMMLPRKFDPEQTAGVIGLQNWLRRQFADNKRYDQIVAELLVATGGDESGPALFYTALGLKPEELGTTTARLFLGVRLDCAQCHKHPFDQWTQEDFWGYAAFFAQLQQRSQNASRIRLVDTRSGDVRLPDSETIVPPKYLGGSPADKNEGGTRRQQLAIWMVSRDNQYLARATVNLVWAQLFGRGLVEPLDDFGEHNPPSHPEILTELADFFVRSNCDLRQLYFVLANTQAYQLASHSKVGVDPPEEMFSQMIVKTLTPEQLYDSVKRVSLARSEAQDMLADPQRQAFLVKMQTQTRSVTDFEVGVPQALMLMNGPELNLKSDIAQGGLLVALGSPVFSNQERVETAFLSTLARMPREDEKKHFLDFLEANGTSNQNEALSDIVWALLNSAEFTLNH